MRVLVKTTDLVLISYVEALLGDRGIASLVLDTHASVMEGSIGVLIPRRIMVEEEDYSAARRALAEAGLGGELEKQ